MIRYQTIYFLLLYGLLPFSFLQLQGQVKGSDQKKITGNFERYSFSRLAARMESATGYHFYYDPADVDSMSIDMTLNQATVPQILDELFQNTDFHYAIDSTGRVFITRRLTIVTTLPGSLGGTTSPSSNNRPADLTEDQDQPGKTKLRQMLAVNQLFEIGDKTARPGQGKATIAGYIKDDKTGEAVVGASIFADTMAIAVLTDQSGFYSLTLPKGRHVIKISDAGMKDTRRQVMLYSDGRLNVDMQTAISTLKAVIVSAEKTSNTKSVQMGVNRLNISMIKQVPVVFGETDVS